MSAKNPREHFEQQPSDRQGRPHMQPNTSQENEAQDATAQLRLREMEVKALPWFDRRFKNHGLSWTDNNYVVLYPSVFTV